MFRLRALQSTHSYELVASELYDQASFYVAFVADLKKAKHQVIVESPFITTRRMRTLLPIFRQLTKRGVQIVINTKPLVEQEPGFYDQAESSIRALHELGVLVLYTGGHHRKLAIIDEKITWEGSLNILSQNDSCEIMRRICSKQVATDTLSFLNLEKFLGTVV